MALYKLCVNILFPSIRRIILFGVLFSVCCAEGRVYVVTNTNDTTDISSLRGAIIAANGQPQKAPIREKNTILLSSAVSGRVLKNPNFKQVFHLTIAGVDETNSMTGDLDITRGNLTIIGNVPNVIIDATGLGDRVFQVFPKAQLTLENLTIIGGTSPTGEGLFARGESGGAIYNAGTLVLENCVITNNASGAGSYVSGIGGETVGGDGGGIYNSGALSASDCVIAGNISDGGVGVFGGGAGGGMRNDGVCFLTHCIISGNQSGSGGPTGGAWGAGGSGGNGGGIFNFGTMVIENCIISENFSGQGASGASEDFGIIEFVPVGGPGGTGGDGGGIYNVGKMQLNFSTVHGNGTGNGGNGGFAGGNAGMGGNGAGVFNVGRLILNTSTISGNLCGNGGNGGDGYGYVGADGGSGGNGGGIYNAGSLNLTSGTIALNQTGLGGNGGSSVVFEEQPPSGASGGQGGDGGGILNEVSGTNVVIRNTLIAQNLVNTGGIGGTNTSFIWVVGEQNPNQQIGNAGANGIGFDLAGDFISQGFNLISIGDGSTGFTNAVNADQVGSIARPIDPRLGPLQMNGGFTPTQALLGGSPAIDQGKCFGMHTDQRGHHRPHIYSAITRALGGDGSDIGAFELDGSN